MNTDVVLVDEQDRPLGTANKAAAHRGGGRLHRAFSVFIVDSHGRMLMQRRSRAKPTFAGLWSNACCSHPRPGEETVQAAHRRLKEELGFDTALHEVFTFVYRAEDPAGGAVEHELDHVLLGRYDGPVMADPNEVEEWRWTPLAALEAEIAADRSAFSPWFLLAFPRLKPHLESG